MSLLSPKVQTTRLQLPIGVAGEEPANAMPGTLAFATNTDTVRVKTSTGWQDIGTGGSGSTIGYQLETFGAIGNGVANDSAAWIAFRTAAIADSNAGKGVVLNLLPGKTYTFSGQSINNLAGVRNLTINGNRAKVQNIYNGANNFGFQVPFFVSSTVNLQPPVAGGNYALLAAVAAGQTSLTCLTAAHANIFTDNQFALLTHADIQPSGGYPYNHPDFDWVKVLSHDGGTGVITIDRPARYNYSTDDYGKSGFDIGSVRLWVLPADWNVEWYINELEIGLGPLLGSPNPNSYMTITGKKTVFTDCVLPGSSGSLAQQINFIGGSFTSKGEPDKLVTKTYFKGCYFGPNLAPGFQSASYEDVHFCSCVIDGVLGTGSAKTMLIENSDIGVVEVQALYGYCNNLTIKSSQIRKSWYSLGPTGGSQLNRPPNFTLGAGTSFANGVFTFTRANNNLLPCMVGQRIAMVGSYQSMHPGDMGSGIITRLYQDATFAYIETTIPQTAWPAWADQTKIRLEHVRNLRIENCSGSAKASVASRATALGLQPEEFAAWTFVGAPGTVLFFGRSGGYPRVFRVTVTEIAAAAPTTAFLTYNLGGWRLATDLSAVTGNLLYNIDLKTKGTRSVSTSGVTFLGADSLTFNGAPITALPTDKYNTGSNFINFTGAGWTISSGTPNQWPWVDVEIEFYWGEKWYGKGGTYRANNNVGVGMNGFLGYGPDNG